MNTLDFQNSNLSKIKPKLRTQGRVSGNFGKSKVRAGSQLSEIGVTNAKVVRLITQDQYLDRLIDAYCKTTDSNLKQFIYEEIKKIKIQRGAWSK
jgi:hypothetical protein